MHRMCFHRFALLPLCLTLCVTLYMSVTVYRPIFFVELPYASLVRNALLRCPMQDPLARNFPRKPSITGSQYMLKTEYWSVDGFGLADEASSLTVLKLSYSQFREKS